MAPIFSNSVFFWVLVSILLVTCLIFMIPMFKLLQVQIINFYTGKTTNERFGRAFQRQKKLDPRNRMPDISNSESIEQADSNENGEELAHLNRERTYISRLSMLRMENSFEFNSHIDEKQQEIQMRKNQERRQRKATKVQKKKGMFSNCLCCNKTSMSENRSQYDLYLEHLKANGLQEWEERVNRD